MKKIILVSLLAILLAGLVSCIDDDNNYEYTEINELDGFIENFSDQTVIAGEEVTFSPTFKFTIDSIQPDVSYEWFLDGEKLNTDTPEYTFSSEKSGTYELTYGVIDNKNGMKFYLSINISVLSVWQRGWLILSEDGDRSVLSLIKVKAIKVPYINKEGENTLRDSLVYVAAEKDIVPSLGKGPLALAPIRGYWRFYYDETGYVLYDEVLVKQKDQWVEINGNTMEKSLNTIEEFNGDIPDGYDPVDAVMTYTSKLILNRNGHIYANRKAVANDFHAGFYTSTPLWYGEKFKAIYDVCKMNDNINTIPVLTADNTLKYIWDGGQPWPYPTINVGSTRYNGNVYDIVDSQNEPDSRFQKIDKEILGMWPASTMVHTNDYSNANARWVAYMKDDANNYYMRQFGFEYDSNPPVGIDENAYFEKQINAAMFADYKGTAVFPNKQFTVIGTGSDLWYVSYRDNEASQGTKIEGGSFSDKIVSLSVLDINVNVGSDKYDNRGYNGHLGVAFANGEFRIYEVIEDLNISLDDKVISVNKVSLKQLYPNEESNKVGNNHFGKIIDTLYKVGSCTEVTLFTF